MKIKGVSFRDYACAHANVTDGMSIKKVCKVLGIEKDDWDVLANQWALKMGEVSQEDLQFYSEVFANPKQGLFAPDPRDSVKALKKHPELGDYAKMKQYIVIKRNLSTDVDFEKDFDISEKQYQKLDEYWSKYLKAQNEEIVEETDKQEEAKSILDKHEALNTEWKTYYLNKYKEQLSSLETSNSKRWIAEGIQFKDQLNAFLDAIYSGKEGPEEPNETRGDMEAFMLDKIITLNETGEHKKLRELFPPAVEPFSENFYNHFASSINQLNVLKDGRIIVRGDGNIYINNGYVFMLEDDKITEQKNILAFGVSANKEYIAKVTSSEINIYTDWDGEIVSTFQYPVGYGKATDNKNVRDFKKKGLLVLDVQVFNNGKKVLLTTRNGVFLLEEKASECILPTQEMLSGFIEEFYEDNKKSKKFKIELDYFHAKLSPDNTKIAAGFQMSEHHIYEDKGNGFTLTGKIQARSEYPHAVGFHDKLDHIALASCHFQKSGTIGMDLKNLPITANASWYQDFDKRFDFMDDRNWVYCIQPFQDGYLLGANGGYIWYIDPKDQTAKKYLHLGGTIMSMDFSADKKYLVVGTFSGFIVKLDMTVPERDKTLVTNLNLKEINRWMLWKGPGALIW